MKPRLIKYFIFAFFISGQGAYADMLEKIRIEDAIRSRVETSIKVFDPQAKVQMSFQYRSFQGNLPGTSFSENESYTPSKIEASDIQRVNLSVFSKYASIPDKMKTEIFNQIPIEKYKIFVSAVEVKPVVEKPEYVPVQAKDLNDIVDRTIDTLSKLIGGLVALSLILMLVVSLYQTRKKLVVMKDQMGLLTSAVSENGGGYSPSPIESSLNSTSASSKAFNSVTSNNQNSQLSGFPLAGLKELFSDCYWCEEDAYASWLWTNTNYQQKIELLTELPFLSDYSSYFISLAGAEKNHHVHPYYLTPFELYRISQADLAELVKKNPSLFHHLGAIRQLHLPFAFVEKMKIVNSPHLARPNWNSDKQSPLRKLRPKVEWGELSVADEATLFKNEKLVPENIKSSIRSLAWLAHREDHYIKSVLEKYDTKSLSTAWVGAEEILKKLESLLPEKKLKNLQSHLNKLTPTKNSLIYQSLVDEGLRRDQAA